MNTTDPLQPIVELNVSASSVGKQWLKQLQNAAPEVFMVQPADTTQEVSVVSIPVMESEPVMEAEPETDRSIPQSTKPNVHRGPKDMKIEDLPVDVNPRELPVDETEAELPEDFEIELRQATRSVAAATMSDNAIHTDAFKTISIADIASQIAGTVETVKAPFAETIVADLREKPSEWRTSTIADEKKKERSSADSTSNVAGNIAMQNVDCEEIEALATKIVDRFPLISPTALMFAGSEWNPHVDETCAQVAYQLAAKGIGKVLLLDCELEHSALSKASGVADQPGLTDILCGKSSIHDCIVENQKSNLEFVSKGVETIRQWNIASDKIREFVNSAKERYQFICISVGDAHSKVAKAWSSECDGSFLVVSMTNSSQTVAKSAVDCLQNNGGRILGCVASDAFV